MRKAQVAALTAASLVVASGYYTLADALDLVPGVVTAAGQPVVAAPYPVVSADPGAGATAPAGLDPDAPVPDAATLAGYADALAKDELVQGARVGVSVVDVLTGRELVDRDADTALTPASSVKLLTAWAALSTLGADHRLETVTTLSGSGASATVTLVGGGDVLLAEDTGDPTAVAGRAGLGDLARATAQALAAQGVTSVSVALDDTLFTGASWSPEWEDGYQDYVTQVQPVMLDVSAHGYGTYPSDPAMEAAQAFAARLGEAGVTVSGEVRRAASPQGAGRLAAVSSAPLGDVLGVSLKRSDNTMTEVEARLVALAAGKEASFTGAVAAVRERLEADGLDVSGVVLRDACGLAESDKVPARLLAEVVRRASVGDAGTVGRTLVADLPVGGLDGTLHDRLGGTVAAGTVRAKTGSLDQVVSLSGTVVTSGGRLLAFSVVVDGFPAGGAWGARAAVDSDLVVPMAGA